MRHEFGDDLSDVVPCMSAVHAGAHSRVIVGPDDDLVVPHEHRAAVQHVVEDTRPDQVGVGEEAQGLGQFLDDAAGDDLGVLVGADAHPRRPDPAGIGGAQLGEAAHPIMLFVQRRAAAQVAAEVGARTDVDVEVIGTVIRFPDVEAGDLAEVLQVAAGALGQFGPLLFIVEAIADRAQPLQEACRRALEVAFEDDGVVELGEQVGVDVFGWRVIVRAAGPQHQGAKHEATKHQGAQGEAGGPAATRRDRQDAALNRTTKHGEIKQRRGHFRKPTTACSRNCDPVCSASAPNSHTSYRVGGRIHVKPRNALYACI